MEMIPRPTTAVAGAIRDTSRSLERELAEHGLDVVPEVAKFYEGMEGYLYNDDAYKSASARSKLSARSTVLRAKKDLLVSLLPYIAPRAGDQDSGQQVRVNLLVNNGTINQMDDNDETNSF